MELKLSKKTLTSLNKISRDVKLLISNKVNQQVLATKAIEYYISPTGCDRGTCSGRCTGSCKGGCQTTCKGVFMYS